MSSASTRAARSRDAGFTLVEVLIAVTISAIVFAGLAGVLLSALSVHDDARARNALAEETRFALARMSRAVTRSRQLASPPPDDPATPGRESRLEPGVLELVLDPEIDRDLDGVADADNDGDGRIDEDPAGDANRDGVAGVARVDDDADGRIDEGRATDDDEDGRSDEDWPDPVHYYLRGSLLIERHPDLRPSNPDDATERVIAEGVRRFHVERIPARDGGTDLVELGLELERDGLSSRVETRLRVGADL